MGKSEGYYCDMRGMLSFLLLFLISKKPMHGQEIADELEKRKGERPSPGTIYPALKGLKEAGFIKEKKKGKTVVYTITEKGKAGLKISKERFCRTFMEVFEP
ncbi:MAG TPA: PadR family transcriptional regulator [Candidatus Norongarragalinales archaeon]|nr:PadR family transcriptional regulator [Candidatus Norongarragalinales archaeon]